MNQRATSLGLGAVLALSLPPSGATAQVEPMPGTAWESGGDVTGDGVTNVLDALCVVMSVLLDTCGGGPTPSCVSGPTSYIDLNCDAVCNINDVQLELVHAIGVPLSSGIDSDSSGAPDACEQPVCSGGDTLCGGACVDTGTNTSHCGGCNQPCSGGETCSGGTCTSSSAGDVVAGL